MTLSGSGAVAARQRTVPGGHRAAGRMSLSRSLSRHSSLSSGLDAWKVLEIAIDAAARDGARSRATSTFKHLSAISADGQSDRYPGSPSSEVEDSPLNLAVSASCEYFNLF